MVTRNARIENVHLGSIERFWGAHICFNYGCSKQCTYFSINKIRELLKVLELPLWESLPNTNCRVKASEIEIFEIGHFIKDKWFVV